MNIQNTKPTQLVEKFDEIFGIDYDYRENHNYNLDDGMVCNKENTVGLVVDEESLPQKYSPVHKEFTTNPVDSTRLKSIGQIKGNFIRFEMPTNSVVTINLDYLNQVAELYDLETPISLNKMEGHSENNFFPIRVNHEETYTMVAPVYTK